jgi:predicted ATPase
MMPDYNDLRLLDKAHLLDEMMAIYCNACPQNDALIKREEELRQAQTMAENLKRENQTLRLQISRLEAEKRGDLT